MRRQTGNENDWINALKAAGNLAGTIRTTQAQGLQLENAKAQREEIERQRSQEKRQGLIQDKIMPYVNEGQDPKISMHGNFISGVTPDDVNRFNQGLSVDERLYPGDITSSDDFYARPSEIQKATDTTMKTRNNIQKSQKNLTA